MLVRFAPSFFLSTLSRRVPDRTKVIQSQLMYKEEATTLCRSNSSGFVMLTLLMAITVVGILSTRVMLNTASEVQREREAELIFRGEAIARAIRLYKKRTGSYPSILEDLVGVRPRIIRKLYKDPMTVSDDRYKGDWDLVLCNQTEMVAATKSDPGLHTSIVGVRSFCSRDSKKIYQGKDLVSDWLFLADAGEIQEFLSTS